MSWRISDAAKSSGEINSSTPISTKLIFSSAFMYSVLEILAIVFFDPSCLANILTVIFTDSEPVTAINNSDSDTSDSLSNANEDAFPLNVLISRWPSA